MKVLVLDWETTILNKGNPFDPRNRGCAIAWYDGQSGGVVPIEHGSEPYGDHLADIQARIDAADQLVFFNAKFDLHWLRRYGLRFSGKRIFCVQLAYFVCNGQQPVMPSLNDVCAKFNLGSKDDHIDKFYWSVGIDTPEIPWEELARYAIKDVELTYAAYKALEVPERLTALVSLSMQDLIVLQEMEWNGLAMNLNRAREKAEELKPELEQLQKGLLDIVALPKGVFNVNSPRHISAFLYGGTIKHEYQEPDGIYKSGKRSGEVRLRWREREFTLSRLVAPPKRSQTAIEGVYSTNAKTLGTLNVVGKARKFLDVLSKYAEIEKLVSTYYIGIPALAATMGWSDGIIHGAYNQTVAITGRLSSSGPNLQNLDETVNELVITRFNAD